MNAITSFTGEYRFLSNFYPCQIVFDGHMAKSVEHAYQAAKTDKVLERARILEATTPGKAKRLGKSVTLREHWGEIKEGFMEQCLRLKFSAPVLRQMLLETGDADLIEGNHWHDQEWGATLEDGKWVGKNKLGKLLMKIRTELGKKPE